MIGLLPHKLPPMNSDKTNLNINLNLISFIVYLVIEKMLRPNPTIDIYHNKKIKKMKIFPSTER